MRYSHGKLHTIGTRIVLEYNVAILRLSEINKRNQNATPANMNDQFQKEDITKKLETMKSVIGHQVNPLETFPRTQPLHPAVAPSLKKTQV